MAHKEYDKHSLRALLEVSDIVTLYYYEFGKAHVSVSESHDFWELVFVDKGTMLTSVDGKMLELQENDMFFYKPGVEHQVFGDGEHAFNIVVISFVCKSTAMRFFENLKARVGEREYDILAKIIIQFRRSFFMPNLEIAESRIVRRRNIPLGSDQLIRNYIEELLLTVMHSGDGHPVCENILSKSNENNLASTDITKEIRNYMMQNIHRKITIDELCQVFNFGKTYLSTTFKADTGYTIIDFFNYLKCEHAKDLIREDELSLTQIAEELGFSSLYYFSRIFKQVTQMSPMQYKNTFCSETVSKK